jgi:DNA-binding MarR family transcriptional regulator
MPEAQDQTALISRAVLQLGRKLRSAKSPNSPSLSALALLTRLNAKSPMPAAQLAKAEGLQPQSLTRMLAVLHKNGLIERNKDEADERRVLLSITPKGVAAVRRDIMLRRKWLKEALDAALTPEEQVQLTAAAGLMLKLAQQGGGKPPA